MVQTPAFRSFTVAVLALGVAAPTAGIRWLDCHQTQSAVEAPRQAPVRRIEPASLDQLRALRDYGETLGGAMEQVSR